MNDFDKRNKEYVRKVVEMEREEDMELERVDQDLLSLSSSDEDEGPDVCVPQKVWNVNKLSDKEWFIFRNCNIFVIILKKTFHLFLKGTRTDWRGH